MTSFTHVSWSTPLFRAVSALFLVAPLLAACGGASDARDAAAAEAGRARILAAGSGDATDARYVRLEAVSEVNGNPWTAVAELNLLNSSGAVIPRAGWSISADSEERVGEKAPAAHAIDGDPHTFWHTQWQGGSPPAPHALTINLGSPYGIGGFKYLPRQIGSNGRIAGWRAYTSTDGSSWTLAGEGLFADEAVEVTVMLAAASAANQPPRLAALADRLDVPGLAVSQALAASDPDGDPLSFAATGLPGGLTIDAATGLISGVPNAPGSFRVIVQVSDGHQGMASGAFTWTIAAGAGGAGGSSARQYVRLEAVSEVNGNPWTAVAELNLLDSSGAVMPRAGWSITADSEERVGERAPAAHAIDGDPHTFWHTQWQGGSPPAPHALTINLGSPRNIGGFKYLPRQVGSNGRIAGWRFYTSSDGGSWTQVSQGSFADSSAEQSHFLGTSSSAFAPSAARAARIAAFASGPLVAGARWRAAEPVAADDVRRIASGHHIVYTTAGTTGSTEPAWGVTVLDGRPITDGTAIAYVNGRQLTTTQAGAPSVASIGRAASAGLTEISFAAGDFMPPRFAVVQGCKSISTGTSFIGHYCYANGPAGGSGNATAIASGAYGAGLSANYVYHTNSWEEEFVVTDRLFGLVFANSSSPVNVEIDGVQVQAAPTRSTGAEGWTLTFDYQGVVKRRTVRVVSAAGSVVPALRGVALTAQGRVEAGATSADQVLILGDSINATVTPPTEAGAQMMSYWLQRYLGFGGAINMAVGGSGYVSQNANTYNLPNLLANPVNRSLIAGYAPNITHVVIGAGFNDRTRPVATVQAAALATWRAVRSLLPNVRISVTDGWSGSSGPDAEALALANGLRTTFAAWGDGNARLIPSVGSSLTTAYVNGTGHAGAPPRAGNSSVYTSTDTAHPSPAGARYIGRRLADDIASAWAGAY